MRRTPLLAAAVGVTAAAAFLIGLAGDHPTLRLLSKPLPALAMAAVAASCRHAYGRLIAAGLVACAAGDLLLELGERSFLAGVAAFLLGHLFYTTAFLRETRAWRLWMALPIGLWGAGLLLYLRPGLDEHGMILPLAIYAAVICAMLWRAAARWRPGAPIDAGVLAAIVGALLFVASDSLIAINRFYFDGAHTAPAAIRYWIIVLYWLGQLGITASVMRYRAADAGPGSGA